MNTHERIWKNGLLISETINDVSVTENIGKTKRELFGEPRTFPPISEQTRNIVAATAQAILNPTRVSKEERERRFAICDACEFLIDGKRCAKCGCTVKWKALLEAWHCPINKW